MKEFKSGEPFQIKLPKCGFKEDVGYGMVKIGEGEYTLQKLPWYKRIRQWYYYYKCRIKCS